MTGRTLWLLPAFVTGCLGDIAGDEVGSTTAAALAPVTWTRVVGASVVDGFLTKTSGVKSWDAGASSVERFARDGFVEFTTLDRPAEMPGIRAAVLDFPYIEGLRMDEAMHPLTMMVVGLYGKVLPNQTGAPLRVHIPWKYGFKSGKSIVRIRFTDSQPHNTWAVTAPDEYGFYANVNPNVPHPRWSQARETRLPSLFMNTPTQMFNGYGDEVASLYTGMDLKKYF